MDNKSKLNADVKWPEVDAEWDRKSDESFVQRPVAEKRKIHSKNEFELCYLRHQYLRRVNYNPTEADMAPFVQIVTHQARNTFYTYRNLFGLVGFAVEDLINIAKIHLVSFLGLYKLDKMPQKYEDFIAVYFRKNGEDPDTAAIESKDKANLTMFMKQRMEDVVRVCRQKARNIKGLPVEEFLVFYGPKRPPKETRDLLDGHEQYGFRKLDLGSFKSISKRAKALQKEQESPILKAYAPFKFGGMWYVAVPLEKRSLTLADFSGADLDPYDSIHNKNPEELYFDKVREEEFEARKMDFDGKTPERKEAIIRMFIHKNKRNPAFKEEIQLARKFLKDLRD